MQTKAFDLNIGKILENWEIKHAIREVIANALDEQLLTNSDDIVIQKDNEHWIIRDFGRGLQHTHLTQNENAEKLSHPFVIGKFGIGLKDALATFERHNVVVEIKSKFGIIKTTKMTKHGFGDLVTLHAMISESDDTDFKGTECKIYNISDNDMEEAKQLFLKFSNKQLLDSNKYGQILLNDDDISNIYINGVLVAYEDNFLFSYNVTQLNAQLKKSINRERTNVGRSAYAEIVKKILLSSNSEVVATMLADDLSNFSDGDIHDELSWIDIQEHAVKILNTTGNVLLSTSSDLQSDPDMMDDIKTNGVKIVVIPEHLKSRIDGEKDKEGNAINTFDQYVKSYNDNFEFDYVNIKDFTEQERKLFYLTNDIVEIIGLPLYNTKSLHISNIMQKEVGQAYQIKGVWIGSEKKIVIHRDVMRAPQEYFGILAHEIIHAETGEPDVSRGFENELTKLVGKLCQKVLILEKSKKESIMSDSVKTNDREYELKKSIVSREKELIEKFEKEKQLLIRQHKETEKKLRERIERLCQLTKIKDKKWYQFW